MQTTISKITPIPFVLDEAHLNSILQFLTEYVGTIRLQAKCTDATRTFKTPTELIDFDNTDPRKILELEISASPPDPHGPRVTVELRSASTFGSLFATSQLYLYATGPDHEISYIDQELRHRFATLRPWYAFYTKFQGYHAIMLMMSVVWAIVYWALVTDLFAVGQTTGSIGLTGTLLNLFVLPLVVLVVSYGPIDVLAGVILRLRQRLFPSGFFRLGYQCTVYDIWDKRRRSFLKWLARLFWSLVSSVIALLSYLFNVFSHIERLFGI